MYDVYVSVLSWILWMMFVYEIVWFCLSIYLYIYIYMNGLGAQKYNIICIKHFYRKM